MAKGGFRGMPGGNMGNLMAQAQKMQRQIELAQAEIKELRVTGTAGGGVVKATVGGDHKVYNIEIAREAIDPEDPEGLSDLIVAAVNQASEELEKVSNERMTAITGGVKMPF
ncbi:MAG: YbaB/EbfC family nucleoid-associated protein [Mageeibacillus sp.]|jgi:DNA-binding YbaB/EbfC family protein|nr:YbaB/EbfC family nucleoid-associated protein [Mageeibacillus sp.]MCI1264434.1 YbaB/EbfC family nucleoid-associated protein [Saccharofermentans sp.]MCI1768801.1 YbaB/EbfC family nucleoid-associated protein [Mageeibacillus sp.]